jgi:hypothetical protein
MAVQDPAQLLPMLLWLILVLVFLTCVIGLIFSTRVFYIQARLAWWNRRAASNSSMYPHWLLGCIAGIAAVVVFEASSSQPIPLRLGLMGVTAAFAWIVIDRSTRRFVAWAEQRDAQTRLWRANAREAGSMLREISDPRSIRPETARVLRETLGSTAVHLYMRGSEDFVPVFHDPASPPTPVVFNIHSLLVRELSRFPGPRSLLTASNGRPLAWSRGPGSQLSVEQEQLRVMDAHLIVPIVIDRAVSGFFLFGSKKQGGEYSSAEIRYAEAVTRQSTDRLFFAERAAEDAERVAAKIRHEAAQDFALAARRYLLPPEKIDLGPVELGAGWWGSERNRPLFFDIVGLPGRAAGLLLAEINAPENEAAIRLVQLQALVRSRFRAYDEDLPELVSSIRRALKWPEGVPPVRLFVARYAPELLALSYVNVGFFPPILLRRSHSGADLLRLHGEANPLDPASEIHFTEGRVQLRRDDLIIIANEAAARGVSGDGESWGESRLVDTLLGWEEQPIADLISLARRTVEDLEGELAAEAPSRLLMVLRVRHLSAPLVE